MIKELATATRLHEDSLVSTLYFVDKRFAVKGRLSGILIVVVGLLKKYQEDNDKLIIMLKLLQALASSSKNRSSTV